VHPTLGILARFQAFFYALAFFQSDGVPPPAPARVTQTVETVEKVGDFNNQIHVPGFYITIEAPSWLNTNQAMKIN